MEQPKKALILERCEYLQGVPFRVLDLDKANFLRFKNRSRPVRPPLSKPRSRSVSVANRPQAWDSRPTRTQPCKGGITASLFVLH